MISEGFTLSPISRPAAERSAGLTWELWAMDRGPGVGIKFQKEAAEKPMQSQRPCLERALVASRITYLHVHLLAFAFID